MMRMTFFWTPDLGEFFFEGLNINTIAQLVGLCIAVAMFAIFYEGIKVYSAYARARTAREQMAAVSCAPSESANLLITDNGRQKSFSQRFCRLLNETMVFFFHNSLGYAIMLSVMVYSGWLFLAVILGMSLGYFVFGHITMKVNMESIQTRTTKVLCSPACPEAGTSTGIETKSTTPCQSDSSEYCQQPPATISGACYENKMVCEAQVSGPTYTEVVNDENCCCRL